MVGWMFRDRRTGRIVVVQWPNLSLSLFVVASAIERLAHPHGQVRTAIRSVALVALLWWALDEVVRGVNPWRRILGAVIGSVTLAGVILG